MSLYCVHCDHTFEPEGEGRPRCPKCMRVSDLREVAATNPAQPDAKQARPGRTALRVGVLVAAVAAAAVAAFLLGDGQRPDAAAVVESAELAPALAEKGVDESALGWVQPGEPVAAFARTAASDASGASERVEAVVAAIRARAQASAFVPWSLGATLAREAMRPEAALQAIDEDGARMHLYPLEVVALAAAASRALGVPAQVVELTSWPQAKAPLDPSGVAGYYALSFDGELYDVFAGRTLPAEVGREPVGDPQLVGAGLGLEAVALASALGDTKQATRLAEQALKLAPKSPTVRCQRAAVWGATGAVDQALSEFEAAAQLRRDAARRYHLASAALLTGDVSKAETLLNQLLTEYPDYALARVSVAALEMQRGNADEAARQLDLAEQAAPDLQAVLWARAELLASRGDTAAAKPLARRAFEARKTLDAHLRYAHFQRKIGDLSGSAQTVVAALDMAPAERRGDLRQTLSAMLGPAVMMDVDALQQGESDDADPAPSGEFDLAKPMQLGAGASGGPGLQVGESGDGPLLMMGDTSKLRLRDGKGLKLDLPE